MGAGASAKNKAQTRSEMREQIKNLRSVAEPLTFIVDQGGGSFRAYLFSGLKQIIRIKSVNAWEKLFSKANLAAFKENVNVDLINTSDGVGLMLTWITLCLSSKVSNGNNSPSICIDVQRLLNGQLITLQTHL